MIDKLRELTLFLFSHSTTMDWYQWSRVRETDERAESTGKHICPKYLLASRLMNKRQSVKSDALKLKLSRFADLSFILGYSMKLGIRIEIIL